MLKHVVNVRLSTIQRRLGLSIGGLDRERLHPALALLLVTGGRLGEIFGRRRLFLIGVVSVGASSAFTRPRADRRPAAPGALVQFIGSDPMPAPCRS